MADFACRAMLSLVLDLYHYVAGLIGEAILRHLFAMFAQQLELSNSVGFHRVHR